MKAWKLGRRVAPVIPLTALQRAGCARIGWIAGVSSEGEPLVDYPENRAGPLRAVLAVAATRRNLAAAAQRRQPVIVLFDAGDPERPILLAFAFPPPPAEERPALAEVTAEKLPEVAEVDGRRVRIEGKDEVVLRCGEASITLHRSGKVVIRGVYLESRAKRTNRIKGGSVRVN